MYRVKPLVQPAFENTRQQDFKRRQIVAVLILKLRLRFILQLSVKFEAGK